MSTPSSPQRGGAFVVIGTVLLTGLAAGALCCLFGLAIKVDPAWLMLPFAFAIGIFVRWQGYPGARGAIIAASAMLICIVYAEYLYAAVRMADMLGFPLRDTLFKMDYRIALQIIGANFGISDIAMFVFAPLLAAAIAAGWPSRSKS